MVLSEYLDDELYKNFRELCNKLDLDESVVTASWEAFDSINKTFSLEGEKLHWLGCAIYVASQRIETPTVDTTTVVKGMGINLTTLLRHSNLSFVQFFSNIVRWADMAELPTDFKNKISQLRVNFSVTYNTFKKFHPLFTDIFINPAPTAAEMEILKHRSRKNKSVPCTSYKIFEFTWNLFILLKAEEPTCTSELVKSCHLLYCCIDFVFKNIVAAERLDVLIPAVAEQISKCNNDRALGEVPCLVKRFCEGEQVIKEALHMKVYTFRQLITNFIRNKILYADEIDSTGIFDPENFEHNFKSITKTYETHLLSNGDFDERIFLAEQKRISMQKEQMSTSRVLATDTCDPSAMESPRVVNKYATPLTGRKYLGPRENDVGDKTTVEKVSKLRSLVEDRASGPSQKLTRLFECNLSTLQLIDNVVSKIEEKFIAGSKRISGYTEEEAQTKFKLGVSLFYKYIELILCNEMNIKSNIPGVAQKAIFYQCTLACCLEMVIYCYNYTGKFPWILEILELEAAEFVKVIELIVRCKENLSRELIKHLNRVEETIIESLIWKSSSSLWQVIEKSGQKIPKYEDIALPGQLLYNDGSNVSLSPSNLSATDFYQSSSQVCKNLFPQGKSLTQSPRNINLVKDGHIKFGSQMESENRQVGLKADAPSVPRRTGSLAIIFRKFYNLASIRMQHLCENAPFIDFELKRKIWTVFEDSIRFTDLIKDRHLDQLYMCAIYVICKICHVDILFSTIMKFYRTQPQACSPVYRDVLIERKENYEERGDLINFYNSVYVKAMEGFAIRFQPNITNNIVLSPLPVSRRDFVSPNMHIYGNVFIKPLETSEVQTGSTFNYYFSRSPSKDLKNINRAINSNVVEGKRLLIDDAAVMPPRKRICDRKIQSLVEDRQRQTAE